MMGVRALQCTSPPLFRTHLSSFHLFPVITDYSYFLFFQQPKGIRQLGPPALYTYIYIYIYKCNCLIYGWTDRQHDITTLPGVKISASLAFTAGDVRGKSIGEGKGEALVGHSVKTTQWM